MVHIRLQGRSVPARARGGAAGAAGAAAPRLSPERSGAAAEPPSRDPQPCPGWQHRPAAWTPRGAACTPPGSPAPCGGTAALGFVPSPSRKRGWRWLRPRSRRGRAVMQTERHRESCSEGSGRILTCLSATVSRLSLSPCKPLWPRLGAMLLWPAVNVSGGRESCAVRSFPAGSGGRERGPAVQHGSPYFTAPSRPQCALTAAAAAVAYFSLIHHLVVRLGTRHAPRGWGLPGAWSSAPAPASGALKAAAEASSKLCLPVLAF